MPTPTYTLISEQVLGSAQASVTFSSIPGTYKDLVVECVHQLSTITSGNIYLRYNGDAGTNYSDTWIAGNGTAASSGREVSFTYIYCGPTSSECVATTVANVMQYASTNVNKSSLSRTSHSVQFSMANAHLWRSTAAITSLLVGTTASTFSVGSTFRLWGIVG